MMQIAVSATLALQGTAPTVGDTIWLSRSIAVPAKHVVRTADWDPADPVELLGRPQIVLTGDSARVTYAIVIWRPGSIAVDLPGPLLLGPGGSIDSLRPQRMTLTIKSVLPTGVPDSAIKPQPRASFVAQRVVSPLPLLVLWALSLILLVPLHLWWRQRGTVAPLPTPTMPPVEPPLSRWADDGEYRAVASVSAGRLRAVIAQRVAPAHAGLDTERLLSELAAVRPEWPLRELGKILRALDQARFGSATAFDTMELSQASLRLRDRLLREAA
jgi:hypothetical protein